MWTDETAGTIQSQFARFYNNANTCTAAELLGQKLVDAQTMPRRGCDSTRSPLRRHRLNSSLVTSDGMWSHICCCDLSWHACHNHTSLMMSSGETRDSDTAKWLDNLLMLPHKGCSSTNGGAAEHEIMQQHGLACASRFRFNALSVMPKYPRGQNVFEMQLGFRCHTHGTASTADRLRTRNPCTHASSHMYHSSLRGCISGWQAELQ